MKIAITGATGFIGRHLVRRLIKENFDIRVLAHDRVDFLKKESSSLEIVIGDLLRKETLGDFTIDTDLVIHLAGALYPPFEKLMDLNVLGTANLLEVCYQNKVKKIIFASSYAVYGESFGRKALKETDETKPNTFYGLTKKLAEDFLKYYDDNFGIKYVVLRFSSVYGPENNKGVVYNFLNSIKRQSKVVIYGDGNQARSFLFVSDAVESILKTIRGYNFKRSGIFNIASKELTTINDLARLMERLAQREIRVTHKPLGDNSTQVIWSDIRKAEKILNWYPKISLEDGIKITMSSL